MQKSKFRLAFAFAVAQLGLWSQSGAARADAAGDRVLAAMDEAANRAQTQSLEFDVTHQASGRPEGRLALTVRVKGRMRLTEFTAPADLKGTKLLVLSPTEMYVFLPAFGKVRRIASSAGGQGFMGMSFSHDDFETHLADQYTATVLSESPTEVKLAATPKAGLTPAYGKIELAITKDRMLPTELKYFNAAGTHVKTETRSNYTCQGDVCTPTEQKMVENARNGAWTRMVRKTWRVNEAISDGVFSKRALER